MERTQNLEVSLPAETCYELLLKTGQDLKWHLTQPDREHYTLKWQKGNYWLTLRLYLTTSVTQREPARTNITFQMWNPQYIWVGPYFEAELKKVAEHFEASVAALKEHVS